MADKSIPCPVCDGKHKPKEFLALRLEKDGAVTVRCPVKNKRGVYSSPARATK